MTEDQFIARLAATPRDWEITSVGALRRGQPGQCPITAVLGEPGLAPRAPYLGLDEDLANDIVEAADDNCDADAALRRRLLEACGLV